MEETILRGDILRQGKLAALQLMQASGINATVQRSGWRRRQLLILCYHGISLHDEHEWNSELYMPPSLFRRRMETLRRSGCEVLPLSEALTRLAEGGFKRPTVAITFDDGAHDFYKQALPVVREFDLPVTLYLTSYYSGKDMPVFSVACSYLLWKARGQRLGGSGVTGENRQYNLGSPEGIAEAAADLVRFAATGELSATQKHVLLERLATATGTDLGEVLSRRLLHIMTPGEAREAARAGVDIQLHTHRHRTPEDRDLFAREIRDNRAFIEELTGKPAVDFCYPSGVHRPEFLPWLRELGVRSATTCETGLAARGCEPLLLPRFVDTCFVPDYAFQGWLSGAAALVARRRVAR